MGTGLHSGPEVFKKMIRRGKMAKKMRCVFMVVTLIALGSFFSACAITGGAQQSTDTDGIAPNITYQVADSAQISKVSYFFKSYKGAERLHIEIVVKNISTETKRYRVNIFLPEGPSGGGLYPRKVKGDVKGVAAGEEHTRVFPMYYDQLPSGFTILIKELG